VTGVALLFIIKHSNILTNDYSTTGSLAHLVLALCVRELFINVSCSCHVN